MTADIRITDSKRRRNHGNSTMQSLFGGGRDRKLFQSGGSPQLHAVRRELEKELGFPVFRRNTKGVTLTENGELLLPTVREFLRQEDRIFELSA